MRRSIVWCVMLLVLSAAANAAPLAHEMKVRLDPATRQLVASDRIEVEADKPFALVLGASFAVERLTVDGVAHRAPPTQTDGMQIWQLPPARVLTIRWRSELAPLAADVAHRDTLGAATAVADPNGSFLPAGSGWYPRVPGRFETWTVEIDLPAGQRGLVPGELREARQADGRSLALYVFAHPGRGIDLMAGPYVVAEHEMRSVAGTPIALRTLFHPELAPLAQGYLDAVRDYIARYEAWIGPYPFASFSVVSSPTPTGFGMPGLTYLGIEVLKLPFIRVTSLGHEVLHSWWGNGVYPDYARGNWSEGLTVFMADFHYKEREGPGAARDMRTGWLRDLAAVPRGQDAPLAEFTSRSHGTSQIVGYHKAAMLFFMLRDAIGEDAFDRGLRRLWDTHRFRVADWAALESAFADAAGRDLATNFAPWLTRGGLPEVRIAAAELVESNGRRQLAVELTQPSPPYPLSVPIVIQGAAREIAQRLPLTTARQRFLLDVDDVPQAVQLDPDARLLRRLAPGEAPPILRQVMIHPAVTLVTPSEDARVAQLAGELAARLLDHAPREQATQGDALLVIGLSADVERYLADHALPGRPTELPRGSGESWTATDAQGRVVTVIAARDAAALQALARPLPHYGRQSWVVFDGPQATARGLWPMQAQTVTVRR